jgi:hypothetical protein
MNVGVALRDRVFDGQRGVVRGMINYLVPTGEKPYAYTFDPPPGKPRRSGRFLETIVGIRDGRPVAGELDLDRQGFALFQRGTAVDDLYDDDAVKAAYYPEMERLIAETTGAAKVVVFDHTIRSPAPGRAGATGIREAVLRAHNDYTVASGPQRVRDLLPPDEAERRLRRRFAIINVWRPIRGPLQDSPLALCDATSMRQDDFVASDLIYRDRLGETYAVAFNPAHRWFYFPDMARDEVVLIKCYDSDPARARFTAHTAFVDPTAPADAPPRESIEIRTIAFF